MENTKSYWERPQLPEMEVWSSHLLGEYCRKQELEGKVILCGICPELEAGGAFDFSEVSRIRPRILVRDENGFVEVGNVYEIREKGRFFTNYELRTNKTNIFLGRGHKKEERIILDLPENYSFGKEMIERYKKD